MNKFVYRRRIVQETIDTLSETRDMSMKVVSTLRNRNVSNPSIYAMAINVWEKAIDVLDRVYYGDDPKEITQGFWSKWIIK